MAFLSVVAVLLHSATPSSAAQCEITEGYVRPSPCPHPYAASPQPASPNPASAYPASTSPSAHSLADPLAVQAALELLDDNRSFRALVCDFQMLCRATAPPPREAMQTTYFII